MAVLKSCDTFVSVGDAAVRGVSYLLMAFFKYCCSHLVSGLMHTSRLLFFSLALWEEETGIRRFYAFIQSLTERPKIILQPDVKCPLIIPYMIRVRRQDGNNGFDSFPNSCLTLFQILGYESNLSLSRTTQHCWAFFRATQLLMLAEQTMLSCVHYSHKSSLS